MSEHTPGPWHVKGRTPNECPTIGPLGAPSVVYLVANMPEATERANAHLIAAVTDLLEACKKANTCASIPDCVKEVIRDAVTKATGKETG